MKKVKKSRTLTKQEEARELYHNKKLSIKELAFHYGRSVRTIYRWIQPKNPKKFLDQQDKTQKSERAKTDRNIK